MIDVEPTDDQRALRESVRGALERHAPIERVRAVLDGAPSPFDALELEQGWAAIGVPEEEGGQGGGPVELAIVAEELGRAAVPSGFLARSGLVVPVLRAAGAHELLAALLSGQRRVTVVLSADRPPAPATGTAPFILDAAPADDLLVLQEGSWRLVGAEDPQVAIVPRALADRTRSVADVQLRGAAGEPLADHPWPPLLDALPALLVAADALGVIGRMLDLSVAYVGERRQFGKPVGTFQAVKHLAADLLVARETARSAVQVASRSLQDGIDLAPAHVSAAKALCGDAASRAADTALAMHGAIGYTWEHDLHVFFKRAKLDAALFGTPAAHRERVADTLALTPR